MFFPRCQEPAELRHCRSREQMFPSNTMTSLLTSKSQGQRGLSFNFVATTTTTTKNVNDESSGSKTHLENWQKRHPSQWSSLDVLDLIYFIAYACKEIDVSWVSGEQFQHVDGYKLCRMSKREFVEREPRYGELLYDTVHELLARSNFTPPKLDDSTYTCEPLDFLPDDSRPVPEVDNAIRLPTVEPPFCGMNSATETATTLGAICEAVTSTAVDFHQLPTQIPKFVEELNDDDCNESPNQQKSRRVHAASAAVVRGSSSSSYHGDRGQGVIRSTSVRAASSRPPAQIELGHVFGGYPCSGGGGDDDVDSHGQLRGVDLLRLSPAVATGRANVVPRNDDSSLTSWHRQNDNPSVVYLDISAAHPTVNHVPNHVPNPAPIDLRTGRQPVTSSQLRHQRHSDASNDHCRLLPLCVPQSPTSLSDDGGAAEPNKRKLTGVTKRTSRKRPRVAKQKDGTLTPADNDDDNDDDNVVGDVSGGGRHLWEFIRDLLRAGDRLRGGRGTITVPGSVPDSLPVEIDLENVIRWENREEGVFRIIDSKQVAQLWGRRKHNRTMTYEKLSRALRWCRKNGFFDPLPKEGGYPKKLCFRFGPLANNWRGD